MAQRTIYIPDQLWDRLEERATQLSSQKGERVSVSALLRQGAELALEGPTIASNLMNLHLAIEMLRALTEQLEAFSGDPHIGSSFEDLQHRWHELLTSVATNPHG